ncbi:membrane bound O-acyl transferase family-domain-containing protein [Hypoxylon sp. FL1150]|nr:membrane bound O-acyl transferase family-domain-containing protein [Hypoxylon sp. FL1150]
MSMEQKRVEMPGLSQSSNTMDHVKTLALYCLPVISLFLSFLSYHWAIHTSNQLYRALFFVPYLFFAVFSFIESKRFDIFPALVSLWAQSVALNIIHITSVLFIEKWPSPPRDQLSPASLRSTYRLWSNPRLVPESNTLIIKNQTPGNEPPGVAIFLLRRLLKLALYYSLHTYAIPYLFTNTIGDLYPEDVNLSTPLAAATPRALAVRAWFAVYWIWESIAFLDGANALLSCAAVLAGLDRPADWPALFGRPAAACGLQGFWARFWHQLASRPYKSLARAVVKGIIGVNLPPAVSRALLALVVFFVSGLSHTAVSWHLGVRDMLDLRWFLLNFVGCMGERVGLSIVTCLARQAGYTRKLEVIERSWLGRMAGYLWVFLFFFWSVPLWRYPRLYEQLMVREWMFIFSLFENDLH